MKKQVLVSISLCCIAGFILLTAFQPPGQYPYRWVYASSNLESDAELQRLEQIVQTASQHGLNGLLLQCGADQIDLKPPDYINRLKRLKKSASEKGVEIIPSIFSIGYAGAILAHNPNLAEGLPVEDAVFLVDGNKAVFEPAREDNLTNGGFEMNDGEKVSYFDYPEKAQQNIPVDSQISREGDISLRFEVTRENQKKPPYVAQAFTVLPHRSYRVSAWMKTADMKKTAMWNSNIKVNVFSATDGHQLSWINVRKPDSVSGEWFQADIGFNTLGYDSVKLVIGASGKNTGTLWIDDLSVREVGLVNVLRRPGTPVIVKGSDGKVYEEGRDFEKIEDPELNFNWDHESPAINILKEGRIQNGERLEVSFYHGTRIYGRQVVACMSEPEVYDIWKKNAQRMKEEIGFTKFFLAIDEIRMGGTCEACKYRDLSMAEILGDCVTKACNILKEVEPGAEIFLWSDMFDPNHNAGDAKSYYYHVPGNFYGSWNYLPDDLVIACWYYDMRDKSLPFFSNLGYRTIAGAYYDKDDLENPKGWLESLAKTPGASGIIYTTWKNKYELLPEFGDLVTDYGTDK